MTSTENGPYTNTSNIHALIHSLTLSHTHTHNMHTHTNQFTSSYNLHIKLTSHTCQPIAVSQ